MPVTAKSFHVIGAALVALCACSAPTINWPQFRGPQATGLSDAPAPITWNVETGENIRWQTPIPGLGHACPIIWQDRVYVATAVAPDGKAQLRIGLYGDVNSYSEKKPQQWRLLCLNKATGKILWNKLEWQNVPRTQRHTKASHCNSTPATDGQHIAALFGSEGLFCFDMNGKQLWHKDLGKMDAGWYTMANTPWGFGSSPVIHKRSVIVQCDVVSEQYLAAFGIEDGRELWRTKRGDVPTWSTPLVVSFSPSTPSAASSSASTSSSAADFPTQIVVNGMKHIGGYDFTTGKELWRLKEGGDVPVASPVAAGETVILTSAHGRYRPFRAVRMDSTGDISPPDINTTNHSVVWCHPRRGDYLSTPIVVGDLVWGDLDGIVTCFDAKTGQVYYNERIGGGGEGFTTSPVAANGKLYYTGEQGHVFVVAATKEFKVLAQNKLGGICLSTPAISDGTIFFRTTEKLIAVGVKAMTPTK
jgi:outer membrane protein assembly factor BamB